MFRRQLQMGHLKPYIIPRDIKNLESRLCRNVSCYEDLVEKSRCDKSAYFSAFTAMILMEEAANSSQIWKLDLENVQLILHSTANHIYKVEHNVRVL